MAYSILNNDGTILARIADSAIDLSSTSLSFVGKDYLGPQHQAQNLLTLLTNSANSTEPRSPIKGQLWYDTSVNKLKVYDKSFSSVSAVYVSEVAPIEETSIGEFWFNPRNHSLNFNTPGRFGWDSVLMHPVDQMLGWVFPSTSIVDNTIPRGVSRDHTTLLYNQDPTTAIGVLSQESFVASVDSTNQYFSASGKSNYPIVKGLNIIGNIASTEDLISGGNVIANGLILSNSTTPESSTSPGTKGQIAWDTEYVYVCIANATWRRTALTSW